MVALDRNKWIESSVQVIASEWSPSIYRPCAGWARVCIESAVFMILNSVYRPSFTKRLSRVSRQPDSPASQSLGSTTSLKFVQVISFMQPHARQFEAKDGIEPPTPAFSGPLPMVLSGLESADPRNKSC
jgi:hypothetical protein